MRLQAVRHERPQRIDRTTPLRANLPADAVDAVAVPKTRR